MTDSLVLCYHAVSPRWDAALSVTPDVLERQLSCLLHNGWHAATFHSAVLDPPAGKTLAVTFDDAYASVLDLALPIMRKLGIPGTVFAPTAFMAERQTLLWPGVDHWTKTEFGSELESMSWTDLDGLVAEGWEIGSHSRTHPYLTTLDTDRLREELAVSREEVTRHLGCACTSIAYPYGDVDERVADVARDSGYLAGAALSRRLNRVGPLRVPRVGIYNADTRFSFRLKVSRVVRGLRATRLVGEAGPAASSDTGAAKA